MSCCCEKPVETDPPYWVRGEVGGPAGDVPVVSTEWAWRETLGAVKVRLNIGRMRYRVPPGLHAAGSPSADSPVFVTANYKFSFDCLRKALAGIDAWILVLDTRGINVWCAAAKGTFGTEELVERIEVTRLPGVVSHRRLVVPQLGAPGVAAHEVKRLCGFEVVFGPVRAEDIPSFLTAGMKATRRMREVSFNLGDRMVLAPVEFMKNAGYVLLAAGTLALLSGFGPGGYTAQRILPRLPVVLSMVLTVVLSGLVLFPALMPWLPGRALSAKAALAGLLLASLALCLRHTDAPAGMAAAASILLPTVGASMLGLVFTGSSAHTSLSGVEKETRIALPLQATGLLLGAALWVYGGWAP